MGLLDALLYGLRDVFDSDDNQLPRRSRVKFDGTVTDDPENDRLIVETGGGGGGSPGSPDKSLQTNNAGAFKGLKSFSQESESQLHQQRAFVSSFPEYIFDAGTKTLTRGFGSFITDKFTTGKVTISNIASPFQTANNGVFTITNVAADKLTFAESVVDDDIDTGSCFDLQITVEQGGVITVGDTSDTYPSQGDRRFAQRPEFAPDEAIDTGINDSDEVVPIITIASGGFGVGLGGSILAEDTATNNTKLWNRLAIFARTFQNYAKRLQWRNDVSVFKDEIPGRVTTSGATSNTIVWTTTIPTMNSNTTITLQARNGTAVSGVWVWVGGILKSQIGGSGISASLSGSTITVTGAAFQTIGWYAILDLYGTNSSSGSNKLPGIYFFSQHGGVADFDYGSGGPFTDNRAALLALLDLVASDTTNAVQTIVIDGRYYFSDVIDIRQTVHITGLGIAITEGGPMPSAPSGRTKPASQMVFPSDCDGLRFHSSIDGDNKGGADWSIVEKLNVYCKDVRGTVVPTTNAIAPNGHTGHGIRSHCVIVLRDLYVQNFAGHGIFIQAADGIVDGNADGSVIDNVWSGNHGGCGIKMQGFDAGGAQCSNCSVGSNYGWGIWDESSQGWVITGCIGQGNLGENDPGSLKFSVDSRNHDFKSGGGPIVSGSNSTFVGCFTEAAHNDYGPGGGCFGGDAGQAGGQSGFSIGPTGWMKNASLQYGIGTGSDWLNTFMGHPSDGYISHYYQTQGLSVQADLAHRFARSGSATDWWIWQYTLDTLGGHDYFRLPSKRLADRAFAASFPWFPNGLALGNSDSYAGTTKLVILAGSSGTQPSFYGDASGAFPGVTYEIGDIVANDAPTAGAVLGWRTLAAGTKGTLNASATTATTTASNPVFTASSAVGIYTGCYLSIAGVSNGPLKVTAVSGTSITVTPAPNASVGPGAAVSYAAPTFEDLNTDIAKSAFSTLTTKRSEVQTSSTSNTAVASFTMSDETCCTFAYEVTMARRTAVTKAGTYRGKATYRRTSAGSPTLVGSIVYDADQETTSGDTVTFNVSTNDIQVQVTAADSDGRNWYCRYDIVEVTSA